MLDLFALNAVDLVFGGGFKFRQIALGGQRRIECLTETFLLRLHQSLGLCRGHSRVLEDFDVFVCIECDGSHIRYRIDFTLGKQSWPEIPTGDNLTMR